MKRSLIVLLLLCSCSYDNVSFQAPSKPCNQQVIDNKDGTFSITLDMCSEEVELLNTIDAKPCVRCDHTELDPRDNSVVNEVIKKLNK